MSFVKTIGITGKGSQTMVARLFSFALLAVATLVGASGCCCTGGNACGGPACLTAKLAHAPCIGGCGELYVDEWCNHPPEPDPCDSCGNFTGCGCGNAPVAECRPLLSRLTGLWGIRYVPSNCDQGSCTGCQGGCSGSAVHTGSAGCSCGQSHEAHGMEVHSSEMHSPAMMSPEPRMQAPTPAKVAPKKLEPVPVPKPDQNTSLHMSPAARKKVGVRQASATQPVRR